jgi:hypothetical protein
MKMIRKTITKTFLWLMLMALVVGSCGTKKTVVDNSTDVKTVTGTEDAEQLKLNYMRRVYDNAVYTQNIVSNIDFSIDTGSKDISVGGSLHMRKDDVIRIQLTAFGLMEVGRLEFTKDYVMIVDRIHKEYIKADYNKVSFLQRNGLNFYSLQALFWNMLFMPGTKKVTDDMLKQFAGDVKRIGKKFSALSDEHFDLKNPWDQGVLVSILTNMLACVAVNAEIMGDNIENSIKENYKERLEVYRSRARKQIARIIKH